MIFTERKTIGVFMTKMFAFFDDAVFRALAREGKRLNYDIVVFTTAGYFQAESEYDAHEQHIFRLAAVEKLDGIIIVPESYDYAEFRRALYDMLRERVRCPVVALRHEDEARDCVFTDNREAMRPLIRHLIEDHGLKKICFQTGYAGHDEAAARLEAYKEEMAAHGLPIPRNGICEGTMWTSGGEKAYKHFFSDPAERPEAVVCANDYMAVGLMRALREHGLRVPEDVIVTGFDNATNVGIDMPSLTTIQPDYEGMVAAAMEHLDRRIRGVEKPDGQARIRLAGKLILGESCGCTKRNPDYYRRMSCEAMAKLEAINDQDALMNNMSIDLTACDDLEELHRVMLSRRTANPSVRDHYLCLFGEPGKLMQEAGDKLCLVHAIRDRKDWGRPMITFDRRELLPAMAERANEPQLFFLKLLHQKGHNIGYSVCQYMPGEVPSRTFVQTNVLLAVALENIYHRNELMKLYEERRMSSITDLLTGLLNRRGLMEQVEPLWRTLMGQEVAFVCLDMDHLKTINDTYGHAAGDFAIRLIGRAIQNTLPSGASGARIGGDEFVVFLPFAGNGEAEYYVRQLEEELKRLNRLEDRTFEVSASIGFAPCRLSDKDTIEHCITASDKILYRVKEARHAMRE